MERKLVPWDYFAKRRGLSLAEILRSRGIESYEKLVYWTGRKGVECPSEADYDRASKSLEVVKPLKKKPARKPAAKKPAAAPAAEEKPKTTRKRRTKKPEAE